MTKYYLLVTLLLCASWYYFYRQRFIRGTVVRGYQQGAGLGAATANLDVSLANFPKGLYACTVLVNNKEYHGLLYYGINSVSNKDCLEAHLLQFDGDLYGKEIVVKRGKFLRPPKKFSSLLDLAEQIKDDIEAFKNA